ncbi:hypothetical protein ACFV42_49345, partial [Streptomyces solisilvae]
MSQTKFDEVLAKRRAAKEKERASVGDEIIGIYGNGLRDNAGDWYRNDGKTKTEEQSKPPAAFVAMDVPQLPEYERSPADEQLDGIIKAMPITTAYKRWIGKGEPEKRWDGQTESIMLRCPFPHHVDSHPSAWCNTDKNVWYCDPCDYGGDIYDLAAIRFGYPVPGYKTTPGAFQALRADMAADFGIQIIKGLNGKEYAVSGGDDTTALPKQEAAVPTPRTANGDGVHKGFQIPGVKPISVTLPGQAVPSTPPPVAPPPVAPPVQTAPPVQPAPAAPPVQPPPVAAPIPAQKTTPPAPTPPVTPPVEEKPAEAPPAPPSPASIEMPAGFKIPGFTPISIPAGSPLGTAPPPTPAPTGLVTPAEPKIIVPSIITPTEGMLKKFGLTAAGDDSGDDDSGVFLDWRNITPPESFLGQYMD